MDDEQPIAGDLKAKYELILRSHLRESTLTVVHILPPRDTGGETEILFLTGPLDDREPGTAYIHDDDSDAILIASGW